MTAVGGSIQEISVASRHFAVAADSDVRLKLGGFVATAHRNGDGSTRFTGEQTPWSLSGIEVAIDLSQDDLGFLQRTANNLNAVPCTITLVDGTVYQGQGLVADDLEYSTGRATASLTLMGKGALETQSMPLGF